MGRGGGVVGGRPPSQAAYFVALAGVAALLLMLCCYFLYFCFSKINELSEHASLCGSARAAPDAPARDAYPVQPVVRDSATAMARLCRSLPAARSGATAGTEAGAGAGAGAGSPAGSEGATLSDDTATTAVSPPPAR